MKIVTVHNLKLAIVSIHLLGILMPILTIFSVLSANNFQIWDDGLANFMSVRSAVETYPIIDLRRYSFLEFLSWHNPDEFVANAGMLKIYFRISLFNLFLLILIFLNGVKVKKWLGYCCSWYDRDGYKRERSIVMYSCCFLYFAYFAKIHSGFYLPGIAGWVQKDQSTAREIGETIYEPLPDSLRFLTLGLIPENATPLNNSIVSGRLLFLHFDEGSILPFNRELFGVVFPQYPFGYLSRKVKNTQVLENVIKHKLEYREKNRRFLLPIDLGYPNHTPYMYIDYSDYPSSDLLIAISIWNVDVKIENDKIELVNWEKLRYITY